VLLQRTDFERALAPPSCPSTAAHGLVHIPCARVSSIDEGQGKRRNTAASRGGVARNCVRWLAHLGSLLHGLWLRRMRVELLLLLRLHFRWVATAVRLEKRLVRPALQRCCLGWVRYQWQSMGRVLGNGTHTPCAGDRVWHSHNGSVRPIHPTRVSNDDARSVLQDVSSRGRIAACAPDPMHPMRMVHPHAALTRACLAAAPAMHLSYTTGQAAVGPACAHVRACHASRIAFC
jgi:hypothetical protein